MLVRLLKPPPLKTGDTIGIVSPASGVAAFCPRRLMRGVQHLQDLGFRVLIGTNAQKHSGHTAGTRDERLADLHEMFQNPLVSAIITTIGGYNSHQLLDALDYSLIKAHPKILMGYSDITALLLGIYSQTKMVTFMGPQVLPQLGDYGGSLKYTRKHFLSVLAGGRSHAMGPAPAWTEERLEWEVADDRPRALKANKGWSVLNPGSAQGPLFAGNMSTLLLLAGTPYLPDLTGAILCLEDDETVSPAIVDRYLTQLRQMGVYDRIAALVIGRFPSDVRFTDEDPLEAIVRSATRGYAFPIVTDADFGHTDPIMTLPNGITARLAADESPSLTLLEPAVG